MVLVNVGCGATFHPSWINFDIVPVAQGVRRLDLRSGLPLAASSADACYCSHVLEHLSPGEAGSLLTEMRRVLKPEGVVRIVVPDLEVIVRAYLANLDDAERGDSKAALRYDWMVLELLDQMSRRSCGGEMARFIQCCPQDVRSFIVSRIGREAESFWTNGGSKKSMASRLLAKNVAWYVDSVRYAIVLSLATLVGGRKGRQAVREGWFLGRGEVHRWMYDRRSLKRKLIDVGFSGVKTCRPDESMIPNFNEYWLDMCGEQVRKPDSLFVEAKRG